MKIFLNLLAGVAGGPINRAKEFLDIFDEKYSDGDSLIVIKEKGFLDEYVSKPGRVVIDVVLRHRKLRLLHRIAWENLMMYKVIKTHQPDVFLTFSHYLPFSHNSKIPSVVGVANLAPFSLEAQEEELWPIRLKMRLLKNTILNSCGRATHILALSETCKKTLVDHGLSSDDITVASNGVSSYWKQKSLPSSTLKRIGVTKPFILYVSHVQRYKNQIRLIEAYSRLEPKIRQNYQLVLVGSAQNYDYYRELHSLIFKKNMSTDVLLVPGMDKENLRNLYQSTVLFVCPSLIENCPNTLLEAMMSGAPVAASNILPMPEFAKDAAKYFNPLDEDSICQSLSEILSKPPIYLEEMKTLSSNQAEKYTWDMFVENVRNICYSVV